MKRGLTRLSAGFYDCGDGHSWGPAVRDVYIIHLVTSGKGFFECNGKKASVGQGQLFVIRPGELVHYYPDMSDPFCYKWVDFSGELVQPLFEATALCETPVSPPLDILKIEPLFSFEQYSGNKSGIDPAILSLFAYLARIIPSVAEQTEPTTLDVAIDYIISSLHKSSLSVGEIGAFCGIGRTQLYRVFMAQLGVSPVQYLINERMKRARELLRTSDMAVKSVAYSVGYSDPLYFSNAYKKQYGIAPSDDRRR